MQQFFWLTIAKFLAFFTFMTHGLPTTNTRLKSQLEDPVKYHTDAVDDTIGNLPGVGGDLPGVGSGLPDVGDNIPSVDDDTPCDLLPFVCDIVPVDGDLAVVEDLPDVN